ncbi:MAG: ABC-2 transporter permease [Bacillota bacterium]|nr:ABC-2 transporter permease [Bacillota bacterium]
MKGLLLKDFYNLQKYCKTIALIFVVWCVIFLPDGSVDFLTGLISVLCVMMTVSSFSYDEAAKWERYALTMPLGRSQLVRSKYVLGLILALLGVALSALIGVIGRLLISDFSGDILPSLAVNLGVGLFYAAAVLPFIFKFGAERARLVMILVFLIPFALLMALQYSGFEPAISPTLSPAVIAIAALLLIAALYVISYMLSCRIFAKREF